jgi:hypothetical protein
MTAKKTPAEMAAEKRKADLALFKKSVEDSRVNLAEEKGQPNPNPRDVAILQDLHDRAKQLYAELLAVPRQPPPEDQTQN